jgi:hypothetical protein
VNKAALRAACIIILKILFTLKIYFFFFVRTTKYNFFFITHKNNRITT